MLQVCHLSLQYILIYILIEVQIEKGLAKYRWDQKQDDGKIRTEHKVYDSASKSIDLRELRA